MHPRIGQMVANFSMGASLALFITPQPNVNWYYTENLQVGLYRRCDASSTCTFLPWVNSGEYQASYIARILLIVSAVFISAAIVAQVITWCNRDLQTLKTLLKIEGSCRTLAGILIIIAMISFSAISNVTATPGWSYGWAYALEWVAGLTYLILGIIILISSSSDATTDMNVYAGCCGNSKRGNCNKTNPSEETPGYYNSTVTYEKN